MARSLQYYYNIVFWTNYAIYLLYFIIKYLVALILWILLELADESKKDSYVKKIVKWILPEQWSSRTNERLAKFAKITTPMRWVILQLFGGPLGVVERRDDDYKPDKTDDNNIPTLYIRDKKVDVRSDNGTLDAHCYVRNPDIKLCSQSLTDQDNARVQQRSQYLLLSPVD